MTGRALPLLLCALLGACSTLARPRASSYHPSDADLSVTRIVHGSLILELRGTRVLVDPWFHAGLLTRQAEPLGLVPDGLPTASAILVTRDAPEHLDHRALRDLAAKVPRAIAPATLHATLVDLGFAQVDDLGWWERTTIDGVTVTAVPGGPEANLANGYVLSIGSIDAFVGADGADAGVAAGQIAAAFPDLDVALVPVSGTRVLGFSRGLRPDAAAELAATLGARVVIPIAYGTSSAAPLRWYAGDAVGRFTTSCVANGIARQHIVVLQPGESWHWYPPRSSVGE